MGHEERLDYGFASGKQRRPFRGKKEIAHSGVPLTMFRVSPSAALIVC